MRGTFTVVVLLAGLGAFNAEAAYTAYLYQDDTNVVATGSGSFNLDGLAVTGHFSNYAAVYPYNAGFSLGVGGNFYEYSSLTGGPFSIGSGRGSGASSATGPAVAMAGMASKLYIADGYVSGTPFGTSAATWANTSLATLGVNPGTYTWTWGSGANVDSYTLYAGVSPYPPPPPQPPLEQLVRFAGDAYAGSNYPVAGYTSVPISVGVSTNGFGAAASIDSTGKEIVLAFAGTDDIKDIIADETFVNPLGQPTSVFREYVSSAAVILAGLKSQYPNARITLTGHSLGGAIAQVIASATGLSATTFDAPGPKQTISYLSNELAPLYPYFSNASLITPQVTNYRIYGDLVSTVGTQVGNTVTYVTPISPAYLVDLFPTSTMLTSHSLLMIQERIINNAATTTNIGPTAISEGVSLASTITAPSPQGVIKWGVNGIVLVGDIFFIDPGGVDGYMLTANPGNPLFASVLFPYLHDIDALFRLEEWNGNSWVYDGLFNELETYAFGPLGVDQFRFFVIDKNTFQPPSMVEEFTFGVTFVSNGVFEGKLTQFSSVPEPGTLVLFGTALAWLGFIGRRKSQVANSQYC